MSEVSGGSHQPDREEEERQRAALERDTQLHFIERDWQDAFRRDAGRAVLSQYPRLGPLVAARDKLAQLQLEAAANSERRDEYAKAKEDFAQVRDNLVATTPEPELLQMEAALRGATHNPHIIARIMVRGLQTSGVELEGRVHGLPPSVPAHVQEQERLASQRAIDERDAQTRDLADDTEANRRRGRKGDGNGPRHIPPPSR